MGCEIKSLVIGTKNRDKLRELQSLLKGPGIKILSLRDFPHCPDVHENGRTFEANARKKARFYSRHTQSLAIADDSGLMVSYLKGKPGVYSARFAGPGCTYADNNQKLLRLLKGIPASKRKAMFVCVIAIYDRGRFVKAVRGECRGVIAEAIRGKNGFGYDPVFIPKGFSKTYAELGPAVKNRISHRGKALRAAVKEILAYCARD
ncbi:MAG: RdgB/HAM1 family non-canonical purine NTP pyrophosphatase [Candidatus Omnitrophota bacterium]